MLDQPHAARGADSLAFPFAWWAALPPLLLLGLIVWGAARGLWASALVRAADGQTQALEFDAALADLRRAVSLAPRDARAQLALAQTARTLWIYRGTPALKTQADRAFEEAARLSPRWPAPHYEHARMYAFKERYQDALTLLAPALELDPNNAGYWLERARYEQALGNAAEAQKSYARCDAIDEVRECEGALKKLGNPR